MRDDKNFEDASKSKRIPRYKKVAKILEKTTTFTSTKNLAKNAEMDAYKFTASVSRARRYLCTQGVMITNKMRSRKDKKDTPCGYKRATKEEYVLEIKKSVIRATAQMLSAAKQIAYLEASNKINVDEFKELKTILRDNIRKVTIPTITPKQIQMDIGDVIIKPEFIDEIAEESIED